jgi:hypothetical protein
VLRLSIEQRVHGLAEERFNVGSRHLFELGLETFRPTFESDVAQKRQPLADFELHECPTISEWRRVRRSRDIPARWPRRKFVREPEA